MEQTILDSVGRITVPPSLTKPLGFTKNGKAKITVDEERSCVIFQPTVDENANMRLEELHLKPPCQWKFVRSFSFDNRIVLPSPILRLLKWGENTQLKIDTGNDGIYLERIL